MKIANDTLVINESKDESSFREDEKCPFVDSETFWQIWEANYVREPRISVPRTR